MYYIGIDPGQSGAMAMLSSTGQIDGLIDWPGDEISLAQTLKDWNNIFEDLQGRWEAIAALEDVHAMPKQGVSSTFKFGTNFGIWRGLLAANEIPFEFVRPQAWQKGVIRKADGKKASLIAARRKWPDAELHLVKHHGRADALWIAEWLRLKHR
jgi:crossover junction endodeoxyribonuclease RuvC